MSTLVELETRVDVEELLAGQDGTGAEGVPEGRSLCRTCLHSGDCIHKGPGNETVFDCHEFEQDPQSQTRAEATDAATPQQESVVEVADTARGLCVNCDLRGACIYADTVNGVWHCEEYR